MHNFVQETFGGLNLRDDEDEVGIGHARVATDVLVGDGSVRTRPGYSVFTARSDTSSYNFLYALPTANRLLTCFNSTFPASGASTLQTFNADGTSASTLAVPAPARNATNIATATQTAGTYVALDTGAMRFVDSSGVLSTPVFTGFTPVGAFVATTPKSFRLVVNDGSHRVRWSEPGDPLTFLTTSNLDLWPNDSEAISGIVTWQDKTFVFKRTKFAVFYNEATADNGLTEFQYRSVYNIPTIDFTSGKPFAVGTMGVYYISRNGVWVTDGTYPRKISGVVDPLFSSIPADLVTAPPVGKYSGTTGLSPVWLHYDQNLLYVAYPTNGSDSNASVSTLVWDEQRNLWYMWSTGSDGATGNGPGFTAMATQPTGTTASTQRVLFAATPYVNFSNFLYTDVRSSLVKFDDATSVDHLTAVSGSTLSMPVGWQYNTGYFDLGMPQIKRLRFVEVYLTGGTFMYVQRKGYRDTAEVGFAGAAVSPVGSTARALVSLPNNGRLFQVMLTPDGNSAAVVINRIEYKFQVSDRP
jgi:hypothetical protein